MDHYILLDHNPVLRIARHMFATCKRSEIVCGKCFNQLIILIFTNKCSHESAYLACMSLKEGKKVDRGTSKMGHQESINMDMTSKGLKVLIAQD